ncbi:MAG: hypothetical protein M1828_004513 [Chrysothrix sp. TS-e1954]|nr:MAG: hypothetical protein M1828_004513 [Chrysothrix sp. TS-e1954]
MQRPNYGNPAPAHSPPLHHPVPQHVSTVPQLRSPPPPAPPSQNGYGYPSQQGAAYGQPAFGGIMNDSTAQMAFQFGQSGAKAGQQYLEQNVSRYVSISALKHYFNVSNSYVVNKLILILFPWRHKPWSRKTALGPCGQEGYFLPPRDDLNSPDLYLPLMSFVTYILLSTLLAGLRGEFHPELLGGTATAAFAVVLVEIGILKLGCYLLSITNDSQIVDLVAYSGFKFVGIIVTVIVGELGSGGKGTGGYLGWATFFYTFFALAFFLLRSMKYVLLPETTPSGGGGMATTSRQRRAGRTQFLFGYAFVVQLLSMWALSRQEGPKVPAKT